MENKTNKIGYIKNLDKQNFSTSLNIAIDNNVTIKNILEVNSYIYDEKLDCGNGKAIFTGKIGVKVIYIDVDNMTNTITESCPFNETFVDSAITSDCYINLESKVVNQVVSKDAPLKINLEVSYSPIIYLNLKINTELNTENLFTKTKEIETNEIHSFIDTSFDYTTNLETKDSITKILDYNCYFACENITQTEDKVVVDGKLYSTLLYETTHNGENVIKKLSETNTIKSELNLPNLSECNLDINFTVDKSKEIIETDFEDNLSTITITHKIKAKGVALKPINFEVVEDLYSTLNEIEPSHSKRDFNKIKTCKSIVENITNETQLTEEESAIDEVVANLNIVPEITNRYVKDNCLYIEGVISSTIVYLDEFREYKQKNIELPFIVNTKIELEKLDSVHLTVTVLDTRVKAKRGTILEVEYSTQFNICVYENLQVDLIDNITIKSPYDFSAYDYQIYLAKPMETMWELAKRIKISPDELLKYNKDLPLIMEGKEKIIVKR